MKAPPYGLHELPHMGKNKYNDLNHNAPTELNNLHIHHLIIILLLWSRISTWKPPIDQLVYQLYELTEEEIKIVEGKWIIKLH